MDYDDINRIPGIYPLKTFQRHFGTSDQSRTRLAMLYIGRKAGSFEWVYTWYTIHAVIIHVYTMYISGIYQIYHK